ncbi:kinase-like protein [Trematosphaeria pertusa]|uniref:Kinase-like protein n=1 Tax=Trematosphaeria pertusa TaxID=390896 RepID=A0A6A6J0L2_9PLEO|nr:kinase-like protein [Trematosphaeria pertusa]KAF2255847.1 kinase-like protein [Trematosphaeria pertusa]
MSSMFYRPGDSSSSGDDSSDDREETSGSAQDNLLSRINTLDAAEQSAARSGTQSQQQMPSARPAATPADTSQFRDLLLHTLLEERTAAQIAESLGKDKSDPEVQALARQTYQDLASHLSQDVDHSYASDGMRSARAAAHEGITRFTQAHLNVLTSVPANPASTAGPSQALVALPMNPMSLEAPHTALSRLDPQLPFLLPFKDQPGFYSDRYAREFEELGVVGKGGYGKVYKVKHKLDNHFYAVKKIMISAAKLQKIKEGGHQEMERLLDEVRSLARFDHGNIVRYHNCWLEFTGGPTDSTTQPTAKAIHRDRLLKDASSPTFSTSNADELYSGLNNLTFEEDSGANIVFEASDAGAGAEEVKGDARTTKRKDRRGSQATIATISSTKSLITSIEDAVDKEDGDIETIPRTHEPTFEGSEDASESIMSHSDMPAHLISARTTGPILTLNVQMSLYNTNLAAFLSTEQDPPTHCFHPCISLELLSNIISGVEYLHEQGVVHRDLKPANVFLSLSTSRSPPAGSVDLASCGPCPDRGCLHVTPRIGDFGLVAALGDSCLTDPTSARPVGTEFYRPPGGGRISEKLDVFALGVLGLEMLVRFGTRMERVQALTELRQGQFPVGFAASIGELGGKVQQLVGDMVQADEDARPGCEAVRREIGRIVHGMNE